MGVTQKELQNIAEDIQKQIREQKHLERIMKHGYDMQQWKYKTCFNQDNSLCQDCISGGSMLWAYCNDMEEEYNKFFKKSF